MVDTDYITKESALSCFHDWIDRYGHEHSADEMTERAIRKGERDGK